MEECSDSHDMLVTVSRLLSSRLDLAELLNYIMQLSARIVNSERASLFLLDEKTNELYFDVALGLEPEVQKLRLKLGEGIAGTCAKEGRPIIVNDTSADERHAKKVDSRSGFVTRSILVCPMIVKGHVIGVVQAINKTEGEFDEKDLRNFEAFASQAGIAIENARLFSSVREEKRRLQIFFTQTSEAAILTDLEGRVLLANTAAQAYLELHDMTAGVTSVKQIFSTMQLSPSIEKIFESNQNIVAVNAERSQPKKLFLEGSAVKLKRQDKAGEVTEGWLWIFRDVTARRTEEKLSRSFLSLVSHKLRTPLTVINGYADMLAEDAASGTFSKMSAQGADVIKKQGKKLTGLVEALVNYVAIDETDVSMLKKESVQAHELLAEAVSRYCAKTEKVGVTANFNPPEKAKLPKADGAAKIVEINCPEGIAITADRQLAANAIECLVDNAFKFNSSTAPKAVISCAKSNGEIVFAVQDNGAGLPPEDLGRIFDKFYQVESSFTGQVEGWGIGLAFVKKAAELHGGKTAVRSKLKEGSEFTISFPV